MTLIEFRESQKTRLYALTHNYSIAWLILITLIAIHSLIDLLEAPSKHCVLRSQRKYPMILG